MPPFSRPLRLSAAALVFAAAALVVGPMITPAGAAALKVTMSSGPTVAGDDASLAYSINRQSKAVATRTCTLASASSSTTVNCGSLPTGKKSPVVVNLTLSDLVDGTYTFTVRVTLSDGGRASATSTPFTIDTNSAPTVTARGGIFIVGDAISVTGRVSDDGRPNPPGAVTTTWSVTSGPGAVTFDDEHAVTTAATFAEVGDYGLRLTATDGALTRYADTVVQVQPDTYPVAKVACRTGTLPGLFEQGPQDFAALWQCTWNAPSSNDPDSLAKEGQLSAICSRDGGDPSTKIIPGYGKVFCDTRPVRG